MDNIIIDGRIISLCLDSLSYSRIVKYEYYWKNFGNRIYHNVQERINSHASLINIIGKTRY